MERRTELVELSEAQIAELVRVALPGAAAAAAQPLAGGFANTIFRVDLVDRLPVVLRCYTRDPGCAAKEAALAELVRAVVPAPRPLGHAPAGTAGVPHPVVFWTFAEGRPLRDVALECPEPQLVELARELGRILGSLRSIVFPSAGDLRAATYGATLSVEPWGFAGAGDGDGEMVGFIRYCLERTPAGERLGPALADRLTAYVERCAARWPEPAGPATLVHADFGPHNLLVLPDPSGRWHLSAVLDWEFAHAGDPMSDIGNLLRRREGRDLPDACEAALAAGFADAGVTLPAQWPARARFVDLSSACEFLSSVADRPESHGRARRQIADTLDRDAD